MTGRREDVLKAAAQQMCDAGMRAIGLQGDVRNKEDCERWAQAVTDQLGSLDILVNCAAGAHPCGECRRSQPRTSAACVAYVCARQSLACDAVI